ncbi:MAG: hypothetical protein AB8E15_06445 [Bdellovibrionales bacterium]
MKLPKLLTICVALLLSPQLFSKEIKMPKYDNSSPEAFEKWSAASAKALEALEVEIEKKERSISGIDANSAKLLKDARKQYNKVSRDTRGKDPYSERSRDIDILDDLNEQIKKYEAAVKELESYNEALDELEEQQEDAQEYLVKNKADAKKQLNNMFKQLKRADLDDKLDDIDDRYDDMARNYDVIESQYRDSLLEHYVHAKLQKLMGSRAICDAVKSCIDTGKGKVSKSLKEEVFTPIENARAKSYWDQLKGNKGNR